MEEMLSLFFAFFVGLLVAIPLALWLDWWETRLSTMNNGLTTAEIFRKAADE